MGLHFLNTSSWASLEHFSLILFILLILLAYIVLLRVFPVRGRRRRYHTAWFCAGVFSFYLAESPPIHVAAEEYLLSAHMIQHLLLIMVMPVGLLLGLPGQVWNRLFERRTPARVAATLTHPIAAFLLFNFVYNVWHVPAFYEWALRIHWIHGLEHATFLGGALLMWWPLLHPAHTLPQTNEPTKLVYLFALSAGQLAIVGPLVFLAEPAYTFYASAPRLFGVTLIEDQQMAGILMKMPTLVVFGALFCRHFFRWAAAEGRGEGTDPRSK